MLIPWSRQVLRDSNVAVTCMAILYPTPKNNPDVNAVYRYYDRMGHDAAASIKDKVPVFMFSQFLELLNFKFDVIVLTEICAYNIAYYRNILPGYQFHYALPDNSKVGGVGLFVRCGYDVQEVSDYTIASSDSNKIENLWLEISKENNKFTVGGIYRHPNQNISDFKTSFEHIQDKISNQPLPCVIAGDMNIDLVKSTCHTGISHYVDNLLMHNFYLLFLCQLE